MNRSIAYRLAVLSTDLNTLQAKAILKRVEKRQLYKFVGQTLKHTEAEVYLF